LGVQYLKAGEAERAVEALRSAVKLSPAAFTPRLNYGVALLEKRRFAESESELRQALKINEASSTAHLYLGLALVNRRGGDQAAELRRYEEAEKEFQRAASLGGDQMGLAHYYLGGIYWRKRDYKRAADELETYLKLSPRATEPERERARNAVKELRSK
ncbi:MAG TPA: tetratricopeptide repeat protein, partial [Pyrinomonadaceae bacterium]|jgi:tetratricopeptide (TPR) repeat protein